MMRLRRRSQGQPVRGFSIIELVAAMAILAIMLAFAAPSFREFLASYRASLQTNDLLADLAFARTEAVKLGRLVTVQPVGGVWSSGWNVGADMNSDGVVAGVGEIFREHGPAEQDFSVQAADSSGAALLRVVFDNVGEMQSPTTARAEFAICAPNNDASRSRGIEVFAAGRSSSRKFNIAPAMVVTCP